MTKRLLSLPEQNALRAILQAATIAALMDSRRWQPGDLAFQGGTCLHLVHGSARFSEDLDFMVRGGLSLKGLTGAIARRMQLPATVKPDLSVSVTDAKDGRNPHAFMVTLSGHNVIGSAKVKVELWQTPGVAMDALKLRVSKIAAQSGSMVFVPALTMDEILADKVYALGARDRLKPRDVFDLWWLEEGAAALALAPSALLSRLDIYPTASGIRADTARRWCESARRTMTELEAAKTIAAVAADLRRWLPSSWRMDDSVAQDMVAVARRRLAQGLHIILTADGAGEAQP